jgi:hypothetical protein
MLNNLTYMPFDYLICMVICCRSVSTGIILVGEEEKVGKQEKERGRRPVRLSSRSRPGEAPSSSLPRVLTRPRDLLRLRRPLPYTQRPLLPIICTGRSAYLFRLLLTERKDG